MISPPRTIGRRFTSSRTGGRQISSARLALTLNFGYSPVRGPSRGPRFAAVTFSGGQRRARVQTMPRRPGKSTTQAVETDRRNTPCLPSAKIRKIVTGSRRLKMGTPTFIFGERPNACMHPNYSNQKLLKSSYHRQEVPIHNIGDLYGVNQSGS